jgi:membrane-anchored protein YejM (alkaline phosphatase superfamily)
MYKQYIAYVNTKVIDIIKNIQESRNNNAVIIIQSDHGCRESEITENKADAFRNYSAFFSPTEIIQCCTTV